MRVIFVSVEVTTLSLTPTSESGEALDVTEGVIQLFSCDTRPAGNRPYAVINWYRVFLDGNDEKKTVAFASGFTTASYPLPGDSTGMVYTVSYLIGFQLGREDIEVKCDAQVAPDTSLAETTTRLNVRCSCLIYISKST